MIKYLIEAISSRFYRAWHGSSSYSFKRSRCSKFLYMYVSSYFWLCQEPEESQSVSVCRFGVIFVLS